MTDLQVNSDVSSTSVIFKCQETKQNFYLLNVLSKLLLNIVMIMHDIVLLVVM